MAARVDSITSMVQETIQLTNESLKEFSKADDGEVSGNSVIIVGKTGVGKSTLLHLLAGAVLKAVYSCKTDKTSIEVESSPLAGIHVSHHTMSETTIPRKWTDLKSKISYWDCPGFGDNRGVPQEIANAVCIKKLFHTSKKVAILVVLKDADFMDPRASELMSVIRGLDQLFLKQMDQISKSMLLVVSHAKPSRTVEHVQHNITDVIADLKIEGTQRILLEALKSQPIAIFKQPEAKSYTIDTSSIREEILSSISEIKYAANIEATVNVLPSCKITLHQSYNMLVNEINRGIKEFIEVFRQCVNNFVAPYSVSSADASKRLNEEQRQVATSKLQSVLSQLQAVDKKYVAQEISTIIAKYLEIARLCGECLQPAGLSQALERVKTMTAMEQFVDEDSRIPLEVVCFIQEQETLEKALSNITVMDASEKAEERKQEAIAATKKADEEREKAIAAEERARIAEAQARAAYAQHQETQARLDKLEREAALRRGKAKQEHRDSCKSNCH